jgi:hypothetical protein
MPLYPSLVLEVRSAPRVPTFHNSNIVGPSSGFNPGLGSASKEEQKLLLEGGIMFIPPRSMTPNVEKGMSTFYKLLLLLLLFGFFWFLEWLAFVVFILSSSLCV